ncbi:MULTISPECIES: nucleotidyltransferase family protein [unclassified Coleofasciculus]|uniref:nucleotidyltransferase family protein n=1 Tax=unclassified Coleofasciculus TaxID=2692782 RepID=UPI0018804753|nr:MULTISPECIES: nucleotidyltransferase family protein [unclassified Coleofasciculus]MBE9129557.1 nucleotidyltransferase family protein [Coleofasciculus sp. LEGE 07081]MBE9149029.1 nucleotidyltransferase family protein [Coleofasciculus sp. LEGE 07092]
MTAISPKVEVSEDAIASFCTHWKITEFALFGSILRDDFRPDSDVDVLVSFAPDTKWSLWDIIKIKEELEILFGREVDLVQKDCLRNPFRRYEILSTKQVIYATE